MQRNTTAEVMDGSIVVEKDDCQEGEDDDEDGDEGDEEDEEDEEEGEDAMASDVYRVRCKHCTSVLTERGMSVSLVADPDKRLYSTDLRTTTLKETGPLMKIDTCDCLIRHTFCSSCKASNEAWGGGNGSKRSRTLDGTCDDDAQAHTMVETEDSMVTLGYHVVTACATCMLADNNGHYWLLNNTEALDVEQVDGCKWNALNYNGVPWDEPRVFVNPPPAHLVCQICSDVFHLPVVVSRCGHSFCQGCLMRELDRNGLCPLDRQPVPEAGGWAASEPLAAQVAALKVRCRFGCWKLNLDGGIWEDGASLGELDMDSPPLWCQETVVLKSREQHEATCHLAAAWKEAFDSACRAGLHDHVHDISYG